MIDVPLVDIVLLLYIVCTGMLAALAVFGFALVSLMRRVRRTERMLEDFLGLGERM